MKYSIDYVYEILTNPDIEIFGFAKFREVYNLSATETKQLKTEFYNKFDSKKTQQLLRTLSINNFWNKNKESEYGLILKQRYRESMQKIVESGISQSPEVRKLAEESKIRNGTNTRTPEQIEKIRQKNIGSKRSLESKEKMSEAAKKKFANGYKQPYYEVTPEIRKKISKHTKKMWADGVFHKTGNLFNSKGQQDLLKFIRQNIFINEIITDNTIKYGKSWDILIEELNIIIEYNGTYWHYDKRFYDEHHFDEYRNVYVKNIRENDEMKRNIAINNGYKFFVVWQYDWEMLKDDDSKFNFLNKLLND